MKTDLIPLLSLMRFPEFPAPGNLLLENFFHNSYR